MSKPKHEKAMPSSYASQKTLSVSESGVVLPLPTAPILHTPIDRPMNSTFNSEFDLRLLGTDLVSYDERCDAILNQSLLKSHPTRFTPNSDVISGGWRITPSVKHNCVMNPPTFCLFPCPALGPSTGEDTVVAFCAT